MRNKIKKHYYSNIFFPFSDGKGERFCQIKYKGQEDVLPLQCEEFSFTYKSIYRELRGKMISKTEFDLAMEELQLDAYINRLDYSLESLIFNDDLATYYNLNREDGLVVCCENGKAELCTVKDMIFFADKSQKEQVIPNLNVKPAILPKLLKRHFNLSEADIMQLALYLVSAFAGTKISHNLLILNGCKGSGKSQSARMIQDIVAPSHVGLTVIGKSQDDIAIRLNSSYMVVLDNLSSGAVKKDVSDLLAVGISGGTYVKRKLYHDTKEVIMPLHNMIVITSIEIATKAPDVLDRSLILTLPALKPAERKSEAELMGAFKRDLPKILGACLKIYAQAVNDDREVTIPSTRMVDSFKLMVKAGRCLNLTDEQVGELIWQNQSKVNQVTVEENSAAMCLVEFMEDKESFCDSVSNLLVCLKKVAKRRDVDKFLISQPNALSRSLNQVKSNLEQEYGIFYEIRNIGPYREITIEKRPAS